MSNQNIGSITLKQTQQTLPSHHKMDYWCFDDEIRGEKKITDVLPSIIMTSIKRSINNDWQFSGNFSDH